MPKPAAKRYTQRRVLAVALVSVAVVALMVEPFHNGYVLISITETHGIEAGDLPAILLLFVAVGLAV